MTDKMTTFLLRITPEMKEAVRFLANNPHEISPEWNTKGSGPNSMNEQFYHLMSRILEEICQECMDVYNKTLQGEQKPLAEIMKFFLHDDNAEFCGPDDFEEESIARKYLAEHWDHNPDRSEITTAYADVLRTQKVRDQFISLQVAEFNSFTNPGVREAIQGKLAAAEAE